MLRMIIKLVAPLILIVSFMAPVRSQETGYLFIDSDPVGATVVVDSNSARIWETPALCTLTVGSHLITLHKPFYRPETITLEISPATVVRRKIKFVEDKREITSEPVEDVALYRHYGTLTVLTDISGGIVFVDSVKTTVPTPVTLGNVASGLRLITIAYGGYYFDTTVTVPPGETALLQVALKDRITREPFLPDSGRVTAHIVVELPGCRYRRDPKVVEDRSNITFIGVDPVIRIVAGDTAIGLSHEDLAVTNVAYDHRGYVTSKEIADTSVTIIVGADLKDSFTVRVMVYSNNSNKYINRDHIEPETSTRTVPADFNSGGEINIRVKILADGEVIFRHF